MSRSFMRLITISLALLALITAPLAAATQVKVVTTTPDLADIVQQIGGSRVSVQALCKGYQNPHQVETKPSYLRALQEADAFIQTGISLEIAYAPALLRSARNPKIMPGAPGFLEASQGIKVMQKPTGQVDRSMGDVHPQGNPHYTLSPTNVKMVARNITAFLKRLDPQGADTYDRGYSNYWHQIDQADKRWKAQLAPYAGANIVTYHNSWPYFAAHFKLKIIGNVEPQPGISPSVKHLNQLAETMRSNRVKVVLMEPWFPSNVAKSVTSKTNSTLLTLPILPNGVANTPTYIQMMNYNVSQLAGALAK